MAYSAEGLAAVLRECDFAGQSVLRLRSEKAGPLLAEVSGAHRGPKLTMCSFMPTSRSSIRICRCSTPSSSPAHRPEAFAAQAGGAALAGKTVATIGNPTTAALAAHGCAPDVVAAESTVDGAIEALAREMLNSRMVRSNQSC